MSVKCIVVECQRDAKTRGLCQSCYVAAGNKVKNKVTTWEQLEKLGLCIFKRKDNGAFNKAFRQKNENTIT